MSGALPYVKADAFEAHTRRDEAALSIELVGIADLRVQWQLKAFLQEINRLALELGVSQVVVDLRRLEFMNSSCLKAFVSWIALMRASAHEHTYRIQFHSNQRFLWQERSLEALSSLASDLIIVTRH